MSFLGVAGRAACITAIALVLVLVSAVAASGQATANPAHVGAVDEFRYEVPLDAGISRGFEATASIVSADDSQWSSRLATGVVGHLYDISANFVAPGTLGDDLLSAACRRNSFVPATLVLMADGATKAIEAIEVGDWVWATDPETGETGPRQVIATIIGDGEKDLVDITIEGVKVTATDGHPFWVDDQGRWIEAEDLAIGDRVLLADGALLSVTGVRKWSAVQRVHNLTVAGIHTFYVVVDDSPVLVHNCGFDDAVDTAHGRQRLVEGGFDDLATDVVRASDTVYEQANDALAHVAQTGPDSFDFIVVGDNGVITAHCGFTRADLDGLARNFGWSGYP